MHKVTWLPWLAATTAAACLMFGGVGVAAAKTYSQKGNALAPYNVAKYKTVNNRNLFVTRGSFPTSYTNVFQTSPTSITTTKGKAATLKSYVFLPYNYDKNNWGNPQSLVVTGNGKTMYVLCTNHNDRGFIAKYNLQGLKKLGVMSTNMAALRHAGDDHSKGQLTAADKAVLKNVQVGPTFNTGHGQSLALNPKNGQLWLGGNPTIHSSLSQISAKTLKPIKQIEFMLKNTVAMGENLVFDKQGRAYFYTYSYGGWAPRGAIKIYQGKIYSKSVKFHLVMQGLRHNPGTKNQSLGYNAKRNRLYFVSDDSISSIPVNKLGHLKPSQVEASNFSGHREFEGLQFTNDGAGYLLTNRSSEVMRTTTNNY